MQTYMNSTNTLEAGHTCECGRVHEWPLDVFTKWSRSVPFNCECGIKVTIQEGKVTKKDETNS